MKQPADNLKWINGLAESLYAFYLQKYHSDNPLIDAWGMCSKTRTKFGKVDGRILYDRSVLKKWL
ncbi:MAG: hypothetical protein ACYDBV_07885 [Nitrospiria bacterium]